MKKTLHSLLATSAIALLLPGTVMAQEKAGSSALPIDTGEIIVTARREAESLQDVPVSVQVVTGSSLEKLAITNAEEISKLAPGLSLASSGSNTAVTLRGVTWQPGSGTPATPIYMNEAPFDPGQTISSLFDVGQIEVLRGPQGTSRGAPSISGAITITTRKPDLTEFGGFVQGLYGSGDHWDVQAAINAPIIKDVLAVRLATNLEESDADRIYSVNSSIQPHLKDRSYRATVLFQPTDSLSIQAMYQHRSTQKLIYTQVAGTGSPGLSALSIPANFNGPALNVKDRASVQDQPSDVNEKVGLLTVNASWEVLGQKLTYNYGQQFPGHTTTYNANDPLNILPGFEPFTAPSIVSQTFRTQEVRLSSMRDSNRPFDYDIGWFSKHSSGTQNFDSPTYLNGAFGNPATARPGDVTVPNPRYVLNSSTNIKLGQKFDSFYWNVRFHIDDRTELSGGMAIVRDRVPVQVDIQTFEAYNAVPIPQLPSPALCPFVVPGAVASPVYTTGVVCDVLIPNGFRNSSQSNNNKYTDTLYNVSLSHKFTEGLLVYATTGSSFRTGLPAINNPGLPDDLITPLPETAKSYELGVKASFGRGFTINADVFQLDYKNQLTSFEGVPYYNSISGRPSNTSLAFYRNVDARVRGFEVDVGARPLDHLNLGASVSYSQIKSRGGEVPCDDGVTVTAGDPIHFCASPKGQVLNTQAPFQASANGSYEVAFSDTFGGYFRFNLNFQGKNPNFGNFGQVDADGNRSFRKTPAYAVLDLFAGVTGHEGAWDLGFYAKNVFNKQVELARIDTINSIFPAFAAEPGYDVVRSSRPREYGVTLRYAFGSR